MHRHKVLAGFTELSHQHHSKNFQNLSGIIRKFKRNLPESQLEGTVIRINPKLNTTFDYTHILLYFVI